MYGRYLRKKSLFHLVLGVMLSPLQQSSVIWIGCQTTSTNDHQLSQTCRVVMKGEMMQIMVKKQKAQTMSKSRFNTRKHQVRMTCSLKRVSPAANDRQPNRSSKQKGKSTPKITKSTTKRPWASNARKAKDSDIDMALLKTATSLADRLATRATKEKPDRRKGRWRCHLLSKSGQ